MVGLKGFAYRLIYGEMPESTRNLIWKLSFKGFGICMFGAIVSVLTIIMSGFSDVSMFTSEALKNIIIEKQVSIACCAVFWGLIHSIFIGVAFCIFFVDAFLAVAFNFLKDSNDVLPKYLKKYQSASDSIDITNLNVFESTRVWALLFLSFLTIFPPILEIFKLTLLYV